MKGIYQSIKFNPLTTGTLMVLSLLLLTACGQSGSLYMPDAEDQTQETQAQDES